MLQQGLTIHSSTAESEIPPVDPGRILKGLTEFRLEQSGSLAAGIGVTCRFCYFSYTVDGHEMRYLCRLPSEEENPAAVVLVVVKTAELPVRVTVADSKELHHAYARTIMTSQDSAKHRVHSLGAGRELRRRL
eukprot:s2362_g4.t1